MIVKNYLDPICYKDINEISHLTIREIIKFMEECETASIYITDNNKLIYNLNIEDLIKIITNNLTSFSIKEYIKNHPKEVLTLKYNENLINAHYFMRSKKLKHIAVVDENNTLIGELIFNTISSKIADTAIKDRITQLYNKKYLDVVIEEYKDFNKDTGIIMIDLTNINLIDKFYGERMLNEVFKAYATRIKRSVRDIDFTFRIDTKIIIVTFNNLEITEKIKLRIENILKGFEYKNIKIKVNISLSHFPEIAKNLKIAFHLAEEALSENI